MSTNLPKSPAGASEGAAGGERPSLLALVATFGGIGLTSFGGVTAYVRDALVARRRWVDDQQFLEGQELSQTLPGSNPMNLSIYLAQRLRGPLGALLAAAALILPGTALVLLLGAIYFRHGSLPQVAAVLKGVGAAAVGLTLATTLKVGRKELTSWRELPWVLLTFAVVHLLDLSMLVALFAIAPLCIWLRRPRPPEPVGESAAASEPGPEPPAAPGAP